MRTEVKIGQRYRDPAAFWNVWEVERIFPDLLGVPHAVVVNVADPTETRTMAARILCDRRRFERAASETVKATAAPEGYAGPVPLSA